jgi:hypothetical protein
MLFACAVILVEGDAERFLIPAFAQTLDTPLDLLGISVCSVAGTNFRPYVKFLTGLGIPCSVITDWDPSEGKVPLGHRRLINIAAAIERARTKKPQLKLFKELKAIDDYDDFCKRCEDFGIFSNLVTLKSIYSTQALTLRSSRRCVRVVSEKSARHGLTYGRPTRKSWKMTNSFHWSIRLEKGALRNVSRRAWAS